MASRSETRPPTSPGAEATGTRARRRDDRTPTAARGWWTLVATCLGLLVGTVDTTAINLALPAMGRELSTGLSGMQWVVDAYNMAFAALLLTGGTLGDRFGRRRLFRVGLAVFVGGSVVCALAPTLAVVLGGRVLQGAGSALLLPQSLAILATAFPEPRERNRAMAAWSLVAGVSLAVGPTLGGLLVDRIDWNAIFWINVPVGVLALVLTVRHVPESRDPRARRVDVLGQVLAAAVLGALTFAVVEGRTLGWASPPIVGALAVSVAGVVVFVYAERRAAEPMLPLGLMRRGRLPVAALATACMTFGMYGMLMLMSLDFQQQRGTSALVAGVQLLPLPAVFAGLSPLVARLVTRIGPRLPMTAGLLLTGAGVLGYGLLGGDAGIGGIEAAFVVAGVGLALTTGPAVGVGVGAVHPDRAGLASGIVNLARILGAAVGVAVAGAVLGSLGHGMSHGPAFLSGLRAALIVAGAVELAGALVAAIGVRTPASRP